MKITKYIFFLISSALLIGLFSFKSSKEQILPTKLRISVLDGLGNFQKGVVVSIYEDEETYNASGKPVAKGTTDEKGRVTFKDLKPIPYFIDARKGDMNNDGEGVLTAPLDEGRTNKLNTVIE